MEAPIHAANEVDKGEVLPKVIAGVAGLVIIAITITVVTYSGFWAPPATSVSVAQTQTTQTP